MTITTTRNQVTHVADGNTATFAFDFRVDNSEDMLVFQNAEQQSGNFTIAGLGNPSGGSITFTDGNPANGTFVTIYRVVPITQGIAYRPNDPFPAATHELGLDKLTMICQQLQEQLGRAMLLVPGSTVVDFFLNIPGAAERAGKLLAFDETGDFVIVIEQAEDKAFRWAESDEDVVVERIGGLDRYSAKHWAFKAQERGNQSTRAAR